MAVQMKYSYKKYAFTLHCASVNKRTSINTQHIVITATLLALSHFFFSERKVQRENNLTPALFTCTDNFKILNIRETAERLYESDEVRRKNTQVNTYTVTVLRHYALQCTSTVLNFIYIISSV